MKVPIHGLLAQLGIDKLLHGKTPAELEQIREELKQSIEQDKKLENSPKGEPMPSDMAKGFDEMYNGK